MKFIVGIFLLTVVFIIARYHQKKVEQEEQDAIYEANVAANEATDEEDGTS